jgi:hypothetical protein
MRLFFVLIISIILFSSCTHPPVSPDPLDTWVERNDAAEDFALFRKILEKGHPALTEYVTEKREKALFDSVYTTINDRLTLRSLYYKLNFVINELGCSHTAASLPSCIVDTLYTKKFFFPFPVTFINSSLIANSNYTVPHGTKILYINSVPVSKLLDSLTIYNSVEGLHRETQKYLAASDFSFDYYTRFGTCKSFEILVKDTFGDIQKISPDPISLSELNERQENCYYYDATDVPYSLYINDDINYALLRVSTFEYSSGNQQRAYENFLKNSFELLRRRGDISNLVIDVRENRGGELFNCFLLNSYLCRQPFTEYKSVSAKINRIPYPEYLSGDFDKETIRAINKKLKKEFVYYHDSRYFMPDSLLGHWEPVDSPFLKTITIVSNYRVVSAAAYFIELAKNTAGARIIGMETSGGDFATNGFSSLSYVLPHSKIGFRFSYANLTYSYGNSRPNRGVIPDYVVPDSYESFTNNRDEQLDFIIDSLILKNK